MHASLVGQPMANFERAKKSERGKHTPRLPTTARPRVSKQFVVSRLCCFTVFPTKCFRTREGCRRGLVFPFLPPDRLVYTPFVSSSRCGAPRFFPSTPGPTLPCPACPPPCCTKCTRVPLFFSYSFCLAGRLQENPNGCARVEVLSESSTTARTGRITRTLVRAAEKLGTADGGDAGGSGAGRGGLGGGGSQQSQQVRGGGGGIVSGISLCFGLYCAGDFSMRGLEGVLRRIMVSCRAGGQGAPRACFCLAWIDLIFALARFSKPTTVLLKNAHPLLTV